ncbi:protein kinase domain-containing protein [Ditylenchus destructor]|uniref:Protein kinase domain-containing protein n=1 Tax=Ditylenchus destructor TaxID=166010 RepID=A0AAD4QS25_9BILA|nr:protein kinase domain-containing protein [Ditylenchus destructor]
MAPEIKKLNEYDQIVDSYSLGVVIYAMIYGWKRGEAVRRVHETPINDRGFSRNAKDLLEHLLVQDPHQRYTIAQIKEHKWFAHFDWSDVVNQQYEPPYRPVKNGYYYTTRGRENFIEKRY